MKGYFKLTNATLKLGGKDTEVYGLFYSAESADFTCDADAMIRGYMTSELNPELKELFDKAARNEMKIFNLTEVLPDEHKTN